MTKASWVADSNRTLYTALLLALTTAVQYLAGARPAAPEGPQGRAQHPHGSTADEALGRDRRLACGSVDRQGKQSGAGYVKIKQERDLNGVKLC